MKDINKKFFQKFVFFYEKYEKKVEDVQGEKKKRLRKMLK